MGQEIERKFLVKGNFSSLVTREIEITQAFLSSVPERIVRIRIQADTGYITIKGISNETGISRYEWEKEISVEEARSLLTLCEPGIIEKTRCLVPEKSGLEFEVDVFHGNNEGLIIAEIELPSEDHPFDKPDWLGEEVSGDSRYFNSDLIKKPYTSW